MSNNFKKTKSNSGQAILEIVLILLVVVSMGRLVWGFNKSVQEWGFSYFGDYFVCLIEVGELPSLGGQVQQGICNSQYQAFDWTNGRPPIGGPGGGSGSTSSASNGSSSGGSSGDASSGRNSGGSSQSASEGGDTSRNGGNASRARINSGLANDGSYAKESSGRAGSKEEDEKKTKVDDTSGLPDWALNQNNNAAAGRPERIPVSRKFVIDDDAQQIRGEEQITTTSKTRSQQEDEERAKKIKVRERKVASLEADSGEGIGFGRLFRILIIMCIIIGIVVFFGNQALQISKSSE